MESLLNFNLSQVY